MVKQYKKRCLVFCRVFEDRCFFVAIKFDQQSSLLTSLSATACLHKLQRTEALDMKEADPMAWKGGCAYLPPGKMSPRIQAATSAFILSSPYATAVHSLCQKMQIAAKIVDICAREYRTCARCSVIPKNEIGSAA